MQALQELNRAVPTAARGSHKRLISIGGGKGGVGKSLVVANLAATLAQQGARVTILDADLGAPNLHSFFGIRIPPRTIESFLNGQVGSLAEVALETSVPGLQLLCGTPHVLGAANPDRTAMLRLVEQLNALETDCLLIDVGAGTDLNTLDFFNAADIRIVVMAPEVTSIQNGYGFIKMALYRRLQRAIASSDAAGRLFATMGKQAFEIGSSMEKIETFLSVLEGEAAELGQPLRMLLQESNLKLVGNMIAEQREHDVIYAVKRAAQQFLSLDVEILGMLWSDARVRPSLDQGRPLVLSGGQDQNIHAFSSMGRSVLQQDLRPIKRLRTRVTEELRTADSGFSFGLDGVTGGEEAPPQPEPAPKPEAFVQGVQQVQRRSTRIPVNHHVKLYFDGEWHLGRMIEVGEAGACVTGISAADHWASSEGRLQLVSSDHELPVALYSYNATTGRLLVQFRDLARAAALVQACTPTHAPNPLI